MSDSFESDRPSVSLPPDPTSIALSALIARYHKGDKAARDELVTYAYDRLLRLARKLKRGFQVDVETLDIHHEAMIRLLRTLQQVEPKDLRHFLNLSALKIRQTLYDLVRGPRQPMQFGAVSPSAETESDDFIWGDMAGSTTLDPGKLALWTEVHRIIDELKPELKEVVNLLWYHEMTHPGAAAVLEVNERTVRRRWREARLILGERLPFMP